MLTLLRRGAGFVAVAKPAGRIVVPGRGAAATEITLRDEVAAQLGVEVLPVHRLDRGTSGVLLFATDAAAHRALSRAFEGRKVVKRYWALVSGALYGAGEIDRPLVPIRAGRVRPGRAGERGAKPSRTAWRALERLGPYTAVELRPASGRLHQIRAHVAAIDHPLAVDPDYGGGDRLVAGDVVIDRLTLHALAIKFPDPGTGAPVEVEAPLADDLAAAVERLRGGLR